MRALLSPNLPEGKVLVAVSAMDIPGVITIKPPHIAALPEGIKTHADLQLCHLGEKTLLCAPEVHSYYNMMLSRYGFRILKGETRIGSTYPFDAAYNICRVGNAAFHNPKITDPVALRYFKAYNIKTIAIGQGYAKCNILPLDAHTILTEDEGIKKAAEREGFAVLYISPGNVVLPGFPYGFIGGASGKLSKDTVYVTGKLPFCENKEKILSFFAKRGIKILEGCIPNPVDIGSVIPLVTV